MMETITKVEVTHTLMEEHRLIGRMLPLLVKAAENLERGDEVSATVFDRGLDFIHNFADRWHHAKEEGFLFPALEKQGLPRSGGPLAVMLAEHKEGRQYIEGMAKALELWGKGDWLAAGELTKNARRYAALLTSHISKEDNVLYPMAENMLPEPAKMELLESYARVEKRQGEGKYKEYVRLVEEMEKELKE
jgi:hemerythrin-like domain-containing protein